ncbi:MAG: metallophosphoesterase, partial [Endomicrobium sp.]|nr:metallophosphoesterase [Endomicrobium sp.]
MRRKNFTKQFISLFTALCFMLSFAGQNLSWAAQESAPAADGFKKVFENASRIPAEYGKITSANDFASESVVVNIQDLHNHPQTQRNISRIIEILNKNYNVKEIFVEGAYGKIDTSWLAKIENQAVKDAVIEEMLEQGRLGGAEYYDIKNNKNIPLSGLEDEKRHKENLARLGYILENRPKYETVLKEIIKETGYLEAKYVNGRNKRFKRILDKYKSGKMNSGKFYSVIRKYVENIAENPEQYGNILPIKMQDYPNLQKYSLVTQLNSKTDAKRVYSQLHSLLGFLKEKLPYLAYKTLLEETENLSNAQSLSFFLSGICREYGIDLNAGYKELASFLEMQDLNRSINPVKMIYEERALTEKLRIALSSGRAESEITFLSDFYPVLSDYLTNKLLPEDFAYFSAGFPKFRELYAKYAVTDNLKKIENDFPVFDAYYSLNNQRNSIFVDNILKNRNLSAGKEKPAQGRTDEECLKESGDIIIAVTGGYHSKGLQELLQDRKITNMVITPSIMSGTEKSEDLYEKILKMQNAFAREALALTIASQAAKAEQFAALANAGVKFLENAGYSKETVDLLFKELSNAAGGDFVRAPVFGESETKIEFSNGNFITIQNDGGKLSVKESFFDEQAAKPEMKFANREIFSVSGSLAESLLADSSAFLKGDFKIVYELIKKFFQFAYDNGFNGFSFADGLTGEIEDALGTFAKGRFSIDGMDKAVIARMPDVFQNFILQQAKESGFATVYEDDSGEAVKIPLKKESKASVLPEETPDSPLKKFEEFFKQVSQEHEEREALLRDYIIALEKGKKSGYQKGALVDLKGVKKEIILVGDLHAREDNLENILKSNNNEEKIKNGEAVIVFLGDIIHSEEEDKLHETESSLKTMERIMRLKVAGPENVYVLLGNHDFIDIYTGKGNVNQGMIYRKYIEGMGPQYARLYRKAIFESALVAVGDTFAAAHAGPVRKSDLNKNPDMESFLRTEGIVESFNTRQSNENFKNSDFIFQLIWNRMGYLSGGYFQHDVDAFLNSLNVKDGALIVGHTPSVLNAGEWHAALGRKDNHHIIFAARDNAGYLSIPAGAKKPDFKFVNAFDANGGRFQIEKLEDY